jgi:hypothetical protein
LLLSCSRASGPLAGASEGSPTDCRLPDRLSRGRIGVSLS